MQRLRVAVSGVVQGVGFRPFVYQLAHELGLNGFVGNDIGGFDDDGIDTYYGAPVSGNPDRTGYGGPLGYFTHNLGNSLDINFYGGLATGSSTYFSLEEPASLSLAISSVAEPASIVLLASGLLLLGFGYRRRW